MFVLNRFYCFEHLFEHVCTRLTLTHTLTRMRGCAYVCEWAVIGWAWFLVFSEYPPKQESSRGLAALAMAHMCALLRACHRMHGQLCPHVDSWPLQHHHVPQHGVSVHHEVQTPPHLCAHRCRHTGAQAQTGDACRCMPLRPTVHMCGAMWCYVGVDGIPWDTWIRE